MVFLCDLESNRAHDRRQLLEGELPDVRAIKRVTQIGVEYAGELDVRMPSAQHVQPVPEAYCVRRFYEHPSASLQDPFVFRQKIMHIDQVLDHVTMIN